MTMDGGEQQQHDDQQRDSAPDHQQQQQQQAPIMQQEYLDYGAWNGVGATHSGMLQSYQGQPM